MIEDPAAWLEVPLADTQLTLLDVASSGRIDLVIDYAGTKIRSAAELLDEFDPQWHDAVQSSFETFVAPDGQLAIRRRGL